MEIQPISTATAASPSPTSSSTSASFRPNPNPDPMQSWWESISKARSRIHSLSSLLSPSPSSSTIPSLADSDRPARALLDSADAYHAVSFSLSRPTSGSGDDPLCQWLYETYQSSDPDLRLVVLSFLPLLSGLYLSRVVSSSSPSLAGFEAVLLSLYAAETKTRAGKPVLVSIPDLSQPSLYHTPRQNPGGRQTTTGANPPPQQSTVGVVFPPLEPQIAVKSTKRACIVGVALDCYYRNISLMPSWSKVDFCEFAAAWSGQDCSCRYELDQDAIINASSASSVCSEIRASSEDGEGDHCEEMERLTIGDGPPRKHDVGNGEVVVRVSPSKGGRRVPLPWELLQPILKILGHCLLGPLNNPDVRDAGSAAVRSIYARASHDLVPQAILASRSLIQLDNSARASSKAAALASNSNSKPNTPSKPRKPEVLLASK